MRIILFILIAIITINFNALASLPVEEYLAKNCKPNVIANYEYLSTKHISHLNYLSKDIDDENADKIIIYGRLLDRACLPIADATIRMWQDNTRKNSLSGTAVTNNLGQFIFITSLNNAKLPNSKLIITHPEFDQVSTKLSLANANSLAAQNVSLNDSWMNDDLNFASFNQNNIYNFDIILPVKNYYKRF